MPPLKKRGIISHRAEKGKDSPCVEKWNQIWEEMASRLMKYKEKHGDCLVPQRYQDDPKLGRWVNKQRENYNSLSPSRKARLNSMGFVWKVVQREPWNVMFQRLVQYKKAHGDCRVPQRYKDDPRLGGWVREQRKSKDSLCGHRRLLLESIDFSWNARGFSDVEPKEVKKLPVTQHKRPAFHHQMHVWGLNRDVLINGVRLPSQLCPSSAADSSATLNLILQKQLLRLRLQQEQDAATKLCLLKLLQQKRVDFAASQATLRELVRGPFNGLTVPK